jgi:hypothetical protein
MREKFVPTPEPLEKRDVPSGIADSGVINPPPPPQPGSPSGALIEIAPPPTTK